MKVFIVAILLAACAAVQGRSIEVHPVMSMMDYHLATDSRIIDGAAAHKGQIPWQAALIVNRQSGSMLCGGSLISESIILTAAHCVTDANSIAVHLGGVNLWTDMEYNKVSYKFMHHENYNPRTLENDIALISLPVPATISDNVKIIPLAARSEPDLDEQPVMVSGYGKRRDGKISEILQFVGLTATNNTVCAKFYPSNVFPSTLCAYGDPYHSTCQGDSGGPLVHYDNQDAVLVGVVSFVTGGGCTIGYPSGYVRVTSYLDWINQQTGIPIRD